jgi:hypothetical protein
MIGTVESTVGMFDWSYFDNLKLIMFDVWKVLFLRKKFVSIQPNSQPNLT